MTKAKGYSLCLVCGCHLLTCEAKRAGICYECRLPDYYKTISTSGLSLEDQYKQLPNFLVDR
jgi:hypothetical protein